MNKRYISIFTGAFFGGMMVIDAHATVTVASGEMAEKDGWVQANLLTGTNLPPFSFTYNGQSSAALLPSWARAETDIVLDSNRTEHVITWSNAALQVTFKAVDYHDFPLVEWTVYFSDIGPRSTPILQGVEGLDLTVTRTNGPEFTLYGNQGDYASPSSYAPYVYTLTPLTVKNFSPPSYSGKSCDGPTGWPYYNLAEPGGGMILAIGWPGQWASAFTRDAGMDLRIVAGQQTTYLSLNPGETIRTPLTALMFWQGTDVVRSQNLWRHFYLAHVIPRVNGQPPQAFISMGGDTTNAINVFLQAGIKPDGLWRDADTQPYTWYPVAPYADTTANWLYTGNWSVETNAYPHGFVGLSTALHKLGMKFLLWFEPERVGNSHSELSTQHPEFLLKGTDSTVGSIFNEGDPAAFHWLTNRIQGIIFSNGVDWYREDMNGCGPLPAWRNNDAANRQGITENFYVQGHLAYWDSLLAMNPGLRIDCCGSGGRRNDLEEMRRGVPLWRSDFAESGDGAKLGEGNQCFTYALSSWLPFTGTSCGGFWDQYSCRSSYVAGFGLGAPSQEHLAAQKHAYDECREVSPIMLNGDYYPLTPYHAADDFWMAWQFDWPDRAEGVVQAFRRTHSNEAVMNFRLQGLDPDGLYLVKNVDEVSSSTNTGAALMKDGLNIRIGHQPGAAIVIYHEIQPATQP